MTPHQYIERDTGRIITEKLFGDQLVNWLYSSVRERVPGFFNSLVSAKASEFLAYLNYQSRLCARFSGSRRWVAEFNIDLNECLAPIEELDTPQKIFERKIRYWDTRPMPEDAIVSPADSRIVVGSLRENSSLRLKDKFFDFEELIGADKEAWLLAFSNGDFAIFRLTPDKYHYNHCPVSGKVIDFYEISGGYHSCNPGAVVHVATPFSKNKRTVTIIDTNVPGGSQVGFVAMVEVVALMIGDIVQSYSEEKYDSPQAVTVGMFLKRGQPKSLYRPGSSTDVLLFQKEKIQFAPEILSNMHHPSATSRFSLNFGAPLVETDLKVRSLIATAVRKETNLV